LIIVNVNVNTVLHIQMM